MRKSRLQFLLVILLFISLFSASANARFTGKVVGVTDGDTISAMHNGRAEKIRLHGIDCPEAGQAFGTRAKQTTSALAFGKTVSVEVTDTDQYGRTVGVVTLPDGTNLNQALVAKGMAWWYKQYAPNSKMLPRLEAAAKKSKLGLWSQPSPMPPWEFRHGGSGPVGPKGGARSSPNPASVRPPKNPSHLSQVTVHVTRTGQKYHAAGCRYVARSDIPISLRKAKARGYSPCSVCSPPR